METFFPFVPKDYIETLNIDAYTCDACMQFLKTKLPMNFRRWFIVEDYDSPECSHLQTYPNNGNESMITMKDESFIVINLLPLKYDHIPCIAGMNNGIDRNDYNKEKVSPVVDDNYVKTNFSYMWNDELESVDPIMSTTYIMYICTHEWMHTLTYTDWNIGDVNPDYLWYMEMQTDMKVLEFIKYYEQEINDWINSMVFTKSNRFEISIRYINDLINSSSMYIRSKIPPCIFD